MFKAILVGVGGGFLGLALAGAMPVLVAILGAKGGAAAIVGVKAWRTWSKRNAEA